MNRIKAVAALLLLVPLYVMAAPAYTFRHFTTSDGLLNNEVKAILRDSYGYLWVGTVSGLNRWDGYRLKAYETAAVGDGIMQMGDISELQEDRDGNVWAKCRSGYVVYRRDAYRFTDVSAVLAKYSAGIKHVQNVHVDREGNVWTVADDKLHLCNYAQGRHYAVVLKTKNGIEDIKSDGRNLLLLDSSGKLHVFDVASRVWKSPAAPPPGVKCNRLYVDNDGAWWMFSTTGSLLLRRTDGVWHTLKLHGTDGRTSNYIRGLQDDGLGCIWIATDHQGLFLYDKRDGNQTNIRHDDHAPSSIAENNVGCIHIDRYNILWTGYTRKGLSYHHPSSRHFINVGGVRNISCIAPGRGGRTWVGTDGYGLRELSSGLTIDIPGNIAVSLLEDSAGRLWVGTYMHGLLCYDGGRLVKHYTVADSPLADNSVYSLQQDRMGRIWTGSLWGHIQCLDPGTGKWQDFRSANREESVAMCFYYDGGDYLYAGTLSGLCRINIVTGNRQMLHGNRHGKPFLRKDIQAILRDRRGLLCLAHGQGITVWDTHTDSLYRLGRRDGLCDEVIRGLYEDKKGYVWTATSNGCSKISVGGAASGRWRFSFCNYTTSDGLLDNNISRHSICGFQNGKILLGTGEGYSIVDAGALDRQSPSQPKVCITGLSISGTPVVPGDDFHGRKILSCPMERLTSLSLRYSDTPIDIEFSSMDLTHSDKVRYAYRLEGLSDRWIETNDPHVTFASLSPGSYRLLVRACSPDGRWSGSAASLLISVSLPFWLSWYALVLYVLAAEACAAWWMRRKFKRRHQHSDSQHKIDVSPHDITITSTDEKLMARAIEAVEANISGDFTVEDLASAVGLTRGHLYKKLMAITGKGPADFIRTIRLKRACQLLARSGMQISEVAYAVGYSSPKIFARNFKAEFGVTPSEYVKQHSL